MTNIAKRRTAMFNLRDEYAEALYMLGQHPSTEERERVEELRKKLVTAETAVLKAGGTI